VCLCPPPPPGPGLPISQRYDKQELRNLIKAAQRSTKGNINTRQRAVTLPLLYELSKNPNLGYEQFFEVAEAIAHHDDARIGGALHVALTRLGKAYDPSSPHTVLTDSVASNQKAISNPYNSNVYWATILLRHSRFRSKWTAPWRSQPLGNPFIPKAIEPRGSLLKTPVAYAAGFSDRLIGLRGVFTKRLGRGTTPQSQTAWRIFLDLVERDPQATLGDVLNTAVTLASAAETAHRPPSRLSGSCIKP
jgi:hypothetical protein